ncbi:MAG: NUDIX domain-containing protein [Anaerolineales bacterium]|nr:NUDIX domain-containing protein [Anaerolineales bacterium]
MPEEPRVGVGVLIEKDGQVLLLRRRNVHGAGSWSTPGGHLDFGESPEECAVREAREETGLEIGEVRFRAITNDVFTGLGKHYITIWMEAQYVSGEPVIQAAYEMSAVGWFDWQTLPDPRFLPFQNLLDGKCHPAGKTKNGQVPER